MDGRRDAWTSAAEIAVVGRSESGEQGQSRTQCALVARVAETLYDTTAFELAAQMLLPAQEVGNPYPRAYRFGSAASWI